MNKNYISLRTSQDIKNKGFSVYSYISSKELLLTVRKDFLDILSVINIPFGLSCIALGVLSYYSGAYYITVGFIILSYSIIFGIILAKLIRKTYYFFLISNVVYTHKGIIFGKSFFGYDETRKLNESLLHYERIFLEYLGEDSKLERYIDERRRELVGFEGGVNTFNKMSKFLDIFKGRQRFDSDMGKLAIPALITFVLYVIFMNFFYAFGYIFGVIFIKIYLFFIRILLSFKKSKELYLKEKTENLDARLKHMNQVQVLLAQKIDSFRGGKIEEIASSTKKSFELFYRDILRVFDQKKDLEKFVIHSKYQDFIDMHLFENYLKKEFNKPVLEMLTLLNDYKSKLVSAQIELKNNTSDVEHYQAQLDTKYVVLQNNLNQVSSQILKLTSSLI